MTLTTTPPEYRFFFLASTVNLRGAKDVGPACFQLTGACGRASIDKTGVSTPMERSPGFPHWNSQKAITRLPQGVVKS